MSALLKTEQNEYIEENTLKDKKFIYHQMIKNSSFGNKFRIFAYTYTCIEKEEKIEGRDEILSFSLVFRLLPSRERKVSFFQ